MIMDLITPLDIILSIIYLLINYLFSVSSESEEPSDSEDQISAPSLTSGLTSNSTLNNNGDQELNKTKAFYIANELMTSERVFVDVLRLLNVAFRDYLIKARRETKNGLMPDSDYSRLFNNLPELQTLNEVSIWTNSRF